VLVAAAALAIAWGGCGSKKPACGGAGAMRTPNGQACACADDCQSGFCASGVCCDSACTGACDACDLTATPGTCSPVPAGEASRPSGACAASGAESCGLDGTCDGKGACRRHPLGTVCRAGSCEGASIVGIYICDGEGACKPGPATICAPFGCDASMGACFSTCQADSDCASGQKCQDASCGKKPRGAVCAADTECASNACADGVCCNVACDGPCVSCNQVGRIGTCWSTEAGTRDTRGICVNQGLASCNQTGTCDGFGACAKYPAETICSAPLCGTDDVTLPRTCDGAGTCRPAVVRSCGPYRCADGACNVRCSGDADCQPGQFCVSGSCGPKPDGQPCGAASECASNHCVDGVCCADACEGPCRSCALASAPGKCTPVSAGAADPRRTCADQGARSCGTDGVCDGAGACRNYRAQTACADESCSGNVYTPAGACDGAGRCVVPDTIQCMPFACNGPRCYETCASDANCSPGNVCNGNSCGKKPNGAFCSAGGECASTVCAQGVCCAGACSGICVSCALSPGMGTCNPVPPGGVDPTRTCADSGAGTCGTTGFCDGGGACATRALGTSCTGGATCVDGVCCAATGCGVCQACNLAGSEGHCANAGTSTACGTASCSGAMYTAVGTCDGAGACAQTTSSCGNYVCGPDGMCLADCNDDGACAPGATCQNGACAAATQ
jgi:hypothetical protein